MELLIQGISDILRVDVLIALFVGSIGGVIIGAIPGVGAAVAIAILLPATFSLDPLVGLTLLLGIYGASMYGGAIPAVLINTPGTAVNALTTYDGYPMTQRGEGVRAISLAYSASFFGGIFSVICLILLAPVLAEVAPYFGSRDIFMAALLGVVLVVVSHRGQSLIAGVLLCVGMFLNTIGMETVRYSMRYTFEQEWLISGFNLIVVLLGLFAISQAFVLLVERDSQPDETHVASGVFKGLKEVFKFKRVATTSSAFGVLMGIIPGVGEFLAQYFSYSLAQKMSKTPEQFGHGAPEGVIASEAANNAVPAAAMVPLLALGIPGEALTAMMLSVFYVHNIIPGPALFNTRPEFLVSLYACLFIVNVLILIFLLLSTNAITKIIRIPTRLLGICILTLSLVGVYSLRNSPIDCAVAAVFGLFGFILKRLDLPLVPIVLGMVLGRILDEKFRNSFARLKSPLDMIDRPISGTIFAIIVIILIAHCMALWRKRRDKLATV